MQLLAGRKTRLFYPGVMGATISR